MKPGFNQTKVCLIASLEVCCIFLLNISLTLMESCNLCNMYFIQNWIWFVKCPSVSYGMIDGSNSLNSTCLILTKLHISILMCQIQILIFLPRYFNIYMSQTHSVYLVILWKYEHVNAYVKYFIRKEQSVMRVHLFSAFPL